MLADFCKHRFLLSLSPAIPTQCGGVHKMKVTTQPVPLRPERAEAPSPDALGNHDASLSPCKGKSFHIPDEIQSFCPYRAPY